MATGLFEQSPQVSSCCWASPFNPAAAGSGAGQAGQRAGRPVGPAAADGETQSPQTERLMGQISSAEHRRDEEATRAAMDRLLRGELPPGGRCDLKTLATEAGIDRTGLYPRKNPNGTVRDGPYQYLPTNSYVG
ncbi:hypothetical protein ACFVXC_41095 [Streptomyces sp. NPDC058257]|uniref:hypothetical protein n=1 Tax=Streptomyces sp. NPDC058257 TaxID=3346409 RepID=UPI0036EB82A7